MCIPRICEKPFFPWMRNWNLAKMCEKMRFSKWTFTLQEWKWTLKVLREGNGWNVRLCQSLYFEQWASKWFFLACGGWTRVLCTRNCAYDMLFLRTTCLFFSVFKCLSFSVYATLWTGMRQICYWGKVNAFQKKERALILVLTLFKVKTLYIYKHEYRLNQKLLPSGTFTKR